MMSAPKCGKNCRIHLFFKPHLFFLNNTFLLQKLLKHFKFKIEEKSLIKSFKIHTIKPVYNDHPFGSKIAAVVDKWSLFRFDCISIGKMI